MTCRTAVAARKGWLSHASSVIVSGSGSGCDDFGEGRCVGADAEELTKPSRGKRLARLILPLFSTTFVSTIKNTLLVHIERLAGFHLEIHRQLSDRYGTIHARFSPRFLFQTARLAHRMPATPLPRVVPQPFIDSDNRHGQLKVALQQRLPCYLQLVELLNLTSESSCALFPAIPILRSR